MKINGERLWDRLRQIASIGEIAPGEGVSRFPWSPEYKESAALLERWMQEAGLETRTDAVGNLFGRLPGEKPEKPPILVGSHLDTVPRGGKFDGIAGVMAALEAAQTLAESGRPVRRPVEAVAFINEEGTQFRGGLFGSKALCGKIDRAYIQNCFDKETDEPLEGSMLEYGMGLDPEHPEAAAVPRGAYHRFLELHIEQGNELEAHGFPAAAVSVIAGIHQFFITFHGEAAHAGGLSMENRRDAMAAAVCTAAEVERLAKTSGSSTRGTVGFIQTEPGEHNIIAGKAVVSVDIREEDAEIRKRIYEQLIAFAEEQCARRKLTFEIEMTADVEPVACSDEIRQWTREAGQRLGIPCTEMVSYAAHDAMVMAEICPAGMVFIRSKNGLSHCPSEYASKEDLEAGTAILAEVLSRYAME